MIMSNWIGVLNIWIVKLKFSVKWANGLNGDIVSSGQFKRPADNGDRKPMTTYITVELNNYKNFRQVYDETI